MKPKVTTPLLASIGAMVMVGTLFLSFYVSTSAYRADGTGIVLPGEVDKAPVADTEVQHKQDDGLDGIEITPDNVQQTIASLDRPDAYSCTIENTLYYGQSSHTISRRQTVKNGVCRTDELNPSGSIVRSTIQSGDRLYAWQTGSSTYYEGKAGAFSVDASGMLPTYETVIALPRETLTEAGSVNLDYEPCIYVGAQDGGHRSVYYVSAVTGLLKRVDIFEGERLIRSSVMTMVSTETPEDSAFALPGGALAEGIGNPSGTE